MGRKWTNIKFRFEDRDKTVPEASSNPKTQEEVVEEYIREKWNGENIPSVQNIDVMFGNYSDKKIRSVMNDFFQEFNFIQKSAVVYVTDSANIGYGWVFERSGGNAKCVEEYTGYEGAFGADVSGEIGDDYGIRINPDWFWD